MLNQWLWVCPATIVFLALCFLLAVPIWLNEREANKGD